MKRLTFADAKPYKSFIEDRDRALDQILFKYRVALSNVLDRTKQDVVSMLSGMYVMGRISIHSPDDARLLNSLRDMFVKASRDSYSLYRLAIKHGHLLAHVGEAEAIGRVLKKRTTYEVKDPITDGKVLFRTKMYYDKLNRKILDALQYAVYASKSAQDFKQRIESAFPKAQAYKRPPRKLKKLTEADRPLTDDEEEDLEQELEDFSSSFNIADLGSDTDMASGLVSQDDWDAMVQDYVAENIDPVTIFGRSGEKYKVGGDEVYDWQLDSDLTHEFVSQVRDGQVDAANQNGVNDFVWIAIVDKLTDECCLWRDGLTTTEIEQALPDHDNDCDGATTAPAHFGCRCRMAPYDNAVDNQDYVDTLPDYGDFDDWINS